MSDKKVSLLEFENNPNIGLFMFANDKFCIIGQEVNETKKKEIENVLGVDVYSATTLATSLIGVFVTGNNDFLIVPEMYDYEIENMKKICSKHDTKLIVLNNKINTYGNSICVGNDEILINPNYNSQFAKEIEKKTKKKVVKIKNKNFESVGGVCTFLNGKYFLSQEFEEEEVNEIIEKIGGIGSINAGSNYISSGIVGNKNGLLLGSMSTTVEIQNVVESLDYL